MSEVLTPEEIAKLVASAKDGTLPDGPRAPTRRKRSIRSINFRRPMKLSMVEQRRFEHAHATFCRDAAMRMSSELREPIEFEVIDSAQLTWEAALHDVPQPSIQGIAVSVPGENTVLICVEEDLVLRMIERLLGGRFTDIPTARMLTQIDIVLARRIFEGLLATLSTVWRGLLGLKVSFLDFEAEDDTRSLELMQASQPTVELTIEARAEGTSSTLLLLVPWTAIKAAPRSLGEGTAKHPGRRADGEESAEAVRSALGAVCVEVRAEAGAVPLTIGEVLALGEGDVVRLGAAGAAGITVGEDTLHRAKPGLSGTKRAVQIIEAEGSGT
jgi:flagellar motor switch protein FliM